MKTHEHDYHLVEPSPIPVLTCLAVLIMAFGAIGAMHDMLLGKAFFILGLTSLVACMFKWWADVIKEGRRDKAHTEIVKKGLSLGMMLFIISEIMIFFVFFWGFFNASLNPSNLFDGDWATIKASWPPANIQTIDPWDIPFLNTLILLLSGTSVTWAHYCLQINDQANTVRALKYTIILAIIFTALQGFEYHHATFKFTEGIYPSVFYMATGFHGAHVIIGTIFLSVCYVRAKKGHFAKEYNHLGFNFAAWYWHFVDAIWLFLFIFIYVWGN